MARPLSFAAAAPPLTLRPLSRLLLCAALGLTPAAWAQPSDPAEGATDATAAHAASAVEPPRLRMALELSLPARASGPWADAGTDAAASAEPSQALVPQTLGSGLPVTPTQVPPSLPLEALDARGGLRLQHLLELAAQAHPTVQATRLDIRASAEDRRAAERQRWPTVSALVENKSNNVNVASSRLLRLEQPLWDAGRISARVEEAGTQLSINQTRVYITVQQLSLQTINAWQNLKAAEGRMAVAQETLAQLGRYRAQMERRVQAEASPPIDLELVLSRTLQTEVELNQAINSRLQALSRIEQLAGLEGLHGLPWSKPALPGLMQIQAYVQQIQNVDWLEVARRHPNVEKARQEAQVARLRLEGKRAEQYPQVYVRVDQPLGATNNDLAGFVGLRYTPGAGLATAVEAQALAERAASLAQSVEVAVREVSEALAADRDDLQSNRSRMASLEKAVEGSNAVLESYSRQFTAGRKTWLDLLNAVRELSQNRAALADSHAAMLAALFRLQVRAGEPVSPND